MQTIFGDDWRLRLSICFFSSIFVALLGPFGTYDQYGFGTRLLYWGGLIFLALLPAVIVREVLFQVLPGSEGTRDLAAAGLIAATIAPPIWAFNTFWMLFDVGSLFGFVEHFAIAFLICLVPVGVRANRRRVSLESVVAVNLERPQPSFMRRLEPQIAGEILRVSADGHQTQVFTAQGQARLRMRFSDVLEALESEPGVRVHRSHWVTLSAIENVRPQGRRYEVTLNCGSVVPVSSSGFVALQDAGFLRD